LILELIKSVLPRYDGLSGSLLILLMLLDVP